MKNIRQIASVAFISLLFSSCLSDFLADEDDKRIVIGVTNIDETVFSKLELYTKKDSAGIPRYGYYMSMVDSNYTDRRLPLKKIPSLGVPFRYLKEMEGGVFEFRATKPDRSILVKEFGLIQGEQTVKMFTMELSKSKITVK